MWPLGRISSEIWLSGFGDSARVNASKLLNLNPICGHMPNCRRRGMVPCAMPLATCAAFWGHLTHLMVAEADAFCRRFVSVSP